MEQVDHALSRITLDSTCSYFTSNDPQLTLDILRGSGVPIEDLILIKCQQSIPAKA